MGEFKYISSWDQLTWEYTAKLADCYINRCMISWEHRPEIVRWVTECCTSIVYCWNGTSTPETNASIRLWTHTSSPHNERCYLLFTNSADNEMFLLKYMQIANVEHLGSDLSKAYQDSKKPIL
jgi:hypothetical protein